MIERSQQTTCFPLLIDLRQCGQFAVARESTRPEEDDSSHASLTVTRALRFVSTLLCCRAVLQGFTLVDHFGDVPSSDGFESLSSLKIEPVFFNVIRT